MLPRTKTVKQDWDDLIAAVPNGHAVQRLVNLLGIEQLTRGNAVFNVATALQGVHTSEPVDYFRRIVAESLDSTELADQTVLKDIDSWNSGQHGPLVAGLLASSNINDEYSSRWEHFSGRHSDNQLLELTAELADRVLARDGACAEADHAGLIGLWRSANRRISRNQHADWLCAQLLKAAPVSLQFVNGLYYYWTGRYGIVDGDTRVEIRRAAVGAVRAVVQSGDDLARVLCKKHPYQVSRFITQTGEDAGGEVFKAWQDLAPILIEGARSHCETVLPELANLSGDPNSGMVAAKGGDRPTFIHPYVINRERVSALFAEKVDELLRLFVGYEGNDPWGTRPKAEAQKWLDERRRTQVSNSGSA